MNHNKETEEQEEGNIQNIAFDIWRGKRLNNVLYNLKTNNSIVGKFYDDLPEMLGIESIDQKIYSYLYPKNCFCFWKIVDKLCGLRSKSVNLLSIAKIGVTIYKNKLPQIFNSLAVNLDIIINLQDEKTGTVEKLGNQGPNVNIRITEDSVKFGITDRFWKYVVYGDDTHKIMVGTETPLDMRFKAILPDRYSAKFKDFVHFSKEHIALDSELEELRSRQKRLKIGSVYFLLETFGVFNRGSVRNRRIYTYLKDFFRGKKIERANCTLEAKKFIITTIKSIIEESKLEEKSLYLEKAGSSVLINEILEKDVKIGVKEVKKYYTVTESVPDEYIEEPNPDYLIALEKMSKNKPIVKKLSKTDKKHIARFKTLERDFGFDWHFTDPEKYPYDEIKAMNIFGDLTKNFGNEKTRKEAHFWLVNLLENNLKPYAKDIYIHKGNIDLESLISGSRTSLNDIDKIPKTVQIVKKFPPKEIEKFHVINQPVFEKVKESTNHKKYFIDDWDTFCKNVDEIVYQPGFVNLGNHIKMSYYKKNPCAAPKTLSLRKKKPKKHTDYQQGLFYGTDKLNTLDRELIKKCIRTDANRVIKFMNSEKKSKKSYSQTIRKYMPTHVFKRYYSIIKASTLGTDVYAEFGNFVKKRDHYLNSLNEKRIADRYYHEFDY